MGGALVLVACSSTNSVRSPVSTGASVPQGTLPGESRQDAVQRIQRSCLDNLGVPYDVLGPYQLFVHATPDLSPAKIATICEAEVQAAGFVENRARTADEITKDYEHRAKWAECLRRVGYDPGSMISLEEYLASGGVGDPLTGIDAMMSAIRSTAEWDQLQIDCPQY